MSENIDKEQQQTEVIYENTPEREQLISIANELGVLSYRINRAYYINTSIIIPSDMKPVEELTTEEVHSLGLKIIQLLNNNLSAKDLLTISFTSFVNSSKLLNLISNLDGCIFTSSSLGSHSIFITHTGYLLSSLQLLYASFKILYK